MGEPRTLSNQATAELADLRARGIAVTDQDVVLINALCWEIESPTNRAQLARGKPIECGGVWFWPLTVSALHWISETADKMPNSDLACAYAMAYDGDCIEKTTWADVRKWSKKVNATQAQLETVMRALIDEDTRLTTENANTDEQQATVCKLSLTMHALHGGTPEMWERQVSIGYVFDFVDTLLAQARAGSDKAGDVLKARSNYALACAISEIEKRQEKKADGE